MANARWKRREREALKRLGGVRLPSNGRPQADGHVTVGGVDCAIEHKSRATLPGWLTDAVDQATRNAPVDTMPIVVISTATGPGLPLRRLAVLRLEDLPRLVDAAVALDPPVPAP